MSVESDQTAIDTTSSAFVVPDGLGLVYIDPASLIVSKQVTFSPNPSDQQRFRVAIGGSILTGTVITTLTFIPNANQSISGFSGNMVVLTVGAGTSFAFIWRKSNNTWYRLQ